mgnify:FL=1
MYPLGSGNPYESVVPVQNRKMTSSTNGTYLNKLDKFAQYKRKKAEQNAKKTRIERMLNEMNLDVLMKKSKDSQINMYDSPKLSRQPINNYLKESEVERLRREISELKTEVIELKIKNHKSYLIQEKYKNAFDNLKQLVSQTERNLKLNRDA